MNRNKYTAYLLGLISVCSGFSKINAMDESTVRELGISPLSRELEQEYYKDGNYKAVWLQDGFEYRLNNEGHLTVKSISNDKEVKNVFPSEKKLRKYVKSVSFEGYISSIGTCAFQNCKNLLSIRIPKSVTSIGNGAFWGCKSLKSIEMPNVEKIGQTAFFDCTNLSSVQMPKVKTIGFYAFQLCTSLLSVQMPNVETIEYGAFAGCRSLVYIDLSSVKRIYQDAFCRCLSLTNIKPPKKLEYIENYVFEECPNLFKEIIQTMGSYDKLAQN